MPELLGDPRGARYEPAALGMPAARQAVAEYYRHRGLVVQPEQVVLCASTSEAYAWLFKLLADPGEQVLVPRPSYPLLPYVAELEGVELVPYPLIREERWRPDLGAVRRCWTARSRAIALVHPNNPTGSLVRRDDAEALGLLAAERGAALVADEVFSDYPQGPLRDRCLPSFVGFDRALCFVLSGLSKVALLPQAKLAWIVVGGPKAARDEALARLELVADTFLSVSTAIQLAAPSILARLAGPQARLRQRLQQNLAALDAAIASCGPHCPVRRLAADAGWYTLVEVPRSRSDDQWVELLLREDGLWVQPGYLFDIRGAGTMVLSLLLEPARFAPAVERAVARWSRA